MHNDFSKIPEENLDPYNWESMRVLGHQMVDDILEYLRSVEERPVWRHAPGKVKDNLFQPLPKNPSSPEEIYREFKENIFPYPPGNIHPRFWGWVLGTGTILGAYADFLASVMNSGACGGLSYHSANYVENQVISWCKEIMGFPSTSSGLLTSGCSAANLIGLAVARNTSAAYDLRREGLNSEKGRMVLYASEEIHSSVQKAVELLGMGVNSLHLVPVNNEYQIDLPSLQKMIDHDKNSNCFPSCVIGAAGTTNTGAIDDLDALADICEREKMWLHVDGAFGAWAVLAPKMKHKVKGMDRADSLAFDFHKWMYMPYEIGCILVRNEQLHRETFSLTPAYLNHGEGSRGMTGDDLPWLHDYGFELSRGFRALKAWMSLKEHGTNKYGRLIQQNIDQASHLAELIAATASLEMMTPVVLNVVNFRYSKKNCSLDELNSLNKGIIIDLQESGIAVPSGSYIGDTYVIHVAITNHRSRFRDFNILVDEVVRLGEKLSKN